MRNLRDALREYLAVRRALGTKLREPAVALGHFLEFLEREGAASITTEAAVRWACERPEVQPATSARRLTAVRRFACWLSAFDPRTEVPPQRIIQARHRRPKPYIFSDQEVKDLMAEAARLPSATGLRARTLTTLIGLLAATGLRPGEALALNVLDVDLGNGILAIRQTKFDKSRFVPVDGSTRTALTRYMRDRSRLCPCPQTGAFFVSERGTRLRLGAVRRAFASVSMAVGLRLLADLDAFFLQELLMDPLPPALAFIEQPPEKILVDVDLVSAHPSRHLASLADDLAHDGAADIQPPGNLPHAHTLLVEEEDGLTHFRFDHGDSSVLASAPPAGSGAQPPAGSPARRRSGFRSGGPGSW